MDCSGTEAFAGQKALQMWSVALKPLALFSRERRKTERRENQAAAAAEAEAVSGQRSKIAAETQT